MITVGFWGMAGIVVLATVCGFGFGVLAMWHPGRPAPTGQAPRPSRPPAPLPRAGYLPTDNAGCYQPRHDWPEPDWPDNTFSEISAGWDRLERTVIAETQPFGKIRP